MKRVIMSVDKAKVRRFARSIKEFIPFKFEIRDSEKEKVAEANYSMVSSVIGRDTSNDCKEHKVDLAKCKVADHFCEIGANTECPECSIYKACGPIYDS
jgi:hypothetical protein